MHRAAQQNMIERTDALSSIWLSYKRLARYRKTLFVHNLWLLIGRNLAINPCLIRQRHWYTHMLPQNTHKCTYSAIPIKSEYTCTGMSY